MAKDPAVLVYIDKWIASTNNLKASFRAWYFDLLLYQYDHGPVPKDLDTMCGICRVRPSEYDEFNQMVNQVVIHKFNLTDDGWVNEVMESVLQSRSVFKDKRTMASNIGVVVKIARRLDFITEEKIDKLKKHLYSLPLSEIQKYKNNQMVNHLVNHLDNLYIDIDVNKDNSIGSDSNYNSGDQNFLKEVKIDNTQYLNRALESGIWLSDVAAQAKINEASVKEKLKEYSLHLSNTLEQKKNYKDFVSHFVHWLNSKNGKSNNNTGSNSNKGYKPAAVNKEELIRDLTNDVANGNIPGQYSTSAGRGQDEAGG